METEKYQHPKVEQRNEHKWLHKLVGEWTYEGEAAGEPGKPDITFKGVEIVRSIGGLWVVAEGKGEMPGGGEATMIMTVGFDVQKGRYVGTWIGSMMTYLWRYDGNLDAAENVLTLNAEGPHMTIEGKIMRYRDVIAFKSDDHRTLTAHMQDEAGKWQTIMTAHYRRRK